MSTCIISMGDRCSRSSAGQADHTECSVACRCRMSNVRCSSVLCGEDGPLTVNSAIGVGCSPSLPDSSASVLSPDVKGVTLFVKFNNILSLIKFFLSNV